MSRKFQIRINANENEYHVAKISTETFNFWSHHPLKLQEYLDNQDFDISDIPQEHLFAPERDALARRLNLNFAGNCILWVDEGFDISVSEINEDGSILRTVFSASSEELDEQYGDCLTGNPSINYDELTEDPSGPGCYVECIQMCRGYYLATVILNEDFDMSKLRIKYTTDFLFGHGALYIDDCIAYTGLESHQIKTEYCVTSGGNWSNPVLRDNGDLFFWNNGPLYRFPIIQAARSKQG